MEKLSYKLESFEGPLDLLLHLIEKNKMSIFDIMISELLDQYMDHVQAMHEQDPELAGDFLDMASRLVQIKAASLLPKPEEAEEMKKELTGQLIEYKKCKQIAKLLSAGMCFDYYGREPEKIKADMRYRRTHPPEYLKDRYIAAVGRGQAKLPPPAEAFSGIVRHRVVSVSSKIVGVMRRLWSGEPMHYDRIFDDAQDKSELVATFLAVLELIKGNRVRVEDDDGELTLRMLKAGPEKEDEESDGEE